MSKFSIKSINEELEQYGWKCTSSTYVNLDEPLEFECDRGHKVYAPWKKIRSKRECPQCNENQYSHPSAAPKRKYSSTYRVLALDQATHLTGYAIMDNDELITYGTYEAIGDSEIERDHNIKQWLISMISQWQPDIVGIEGIQMQFHEGKQVVGNDNVVGVTTFETLARLQGILMETCYKRSVPFVICPTNTWRHHVNCKGRTRADKKKSMQMLIVNWYHVKVSEDESDAIGICKYVAETNKKKPEIVSWE